MACFGGPKSRKKVRNGRFRTETDGFGFRANFELYDSYMDCNKYLHYKQRSHIRLVVAARRERLPGRQD